jgi:hypothetical protein
LHYRSDHGTWELVGGGSGGSFSASVAESLAAGLVAWCPRLVRQPPTRKSRSAFGRRRSRPYPPAARSIPFPPARQRRWPRDARREDHPQRGCCASQPAPSICRGWDRAAYRCVTRTASGRVSRASRAPSNAKRAPMMRPATDAIILSVRVHTREELAPIDVTAPRSGPELEAAGRRILRNRLRRAVRLGTLAGAAGQRAGQQFDSG